MSKRDEEQIRERLRSAVQAAPVGSAWKHIKTGGMYRVVGFAVSESTLFPLVLYSRAEGSFTWARPSEEFLDGRFERKTEAEF